ncbi:MAG: CrcB family protein [Candidatus Poriferisodalaceae bacterium]|nr:MAG: camphor resistance protein CrcB [Acidimicrobiales bacterium MED-G01]
MIIVLFAGFAGLGAVLRWKTTAQWGKLGTLILNLVGAFGLGLISGLDGLLPTVLGTAGVGAMTTISGVAREVHSLSCTSRIRAAIYLGGTLVAGVGAAWVGVHWCL